VPSHDPAIPAIRTYSGNKETDVASTLETTCHEYSRSDGFNVVVFPSNANADSMGAPGYNVSPSMLAGGDPPAVAFAQNQRNEVRTMDVAGALAAEPGVKQQTYVQQSMSVRRLTPVECERLQGFPDNYTRIPYRNKPADKCPDGPRYKALGNSMAVPVMAWVGNRIQMVEGLS